MGRATEASHIADHPSTVEKMYGEGAPHSSRVDSRVDFGFDSSRSNFKYTRLFDETDENRNNLGRKKRSSSLSRITKDRAGGYEISDKFSETEKKVKKNAYEGTSV